MSQLALPALFKYLFYVSMAIMDMFTLSVWGSTPESDVRFWRLKLISTLNGLTYALTLSVRGPTLDVRIFRRQHALKQLKKYNGHRPITYRYSNEVERAVFCVYWVFLPIRTPGVKSCRNCHHKVNEIT